MAPNPINLWGLVIAMASLTPARQPDPGPNPHPGPDGDHITAGAHLCLRGRKAILFACFEEWLRIVSHGDDAYLAE